MSILLDGTLGITTPGLTNTGTETLVNLTTTGNTILGDASTDTLNVGNGGLIKDASGNVGIGVTPSAWGTGSSMDVGTQTSVHYSGSVGALFGKNVYYNAGYKYKATGTARAYVQDDGGHSWSIAASGTAGNAITFTQAMTLDAGGKLLLGVTSGTGLSNGDFAMGNGNHIRFRNAANSAYISAFEFTSANGLNIGTGGSLSTITFGISGIGEAGRFDTSGNLLVGTTNGNSNQYTAGSLNLGGSIVTAGYKYCIISYNSGGSGAAVSFQKAGSEKAAMFYNDSDSRLYVFNANSATGVYMTSGATSWTANSDERLKTDLQPIENAAQKVSTLRAVTGRFKTDDEGVSRAFLIAQDVQAVLPEAVSSGAMPMSDDTTEYLGVSYTDVIPLLVAAIKEQQAIITQLTARITALEAK